jgi:hypothetical protein
LNLFAALWRQEKDVASTPGVSVFLLKGAVHEKEIRIEIIRPQIDL